MELIAEDHRLALRQTIRQTAESIATLREVMERIDERTLASRAEVIRAILRRKAIVSMMSAIFSIFTGLILWKLMPAL